MSALASAASSTLAPALAPKLFPALSRAAQMAPMEQIAQTGSTTPNPPAPPSVDAPANHPLDALASGGRVRLQDVVFPNGSTFLAETAQDRIEPLASRELEVKPIERALLSAFMSARQLDSGALSLCPYTDTLSASGRCSTQHYVYPTARLHLCAA